MCQPIAACGALTPRQLWFEYQRLLGCADRAEGGRSPRCHQRGSYILPHHRVQVHGSVHGAYQIVTAAAWSVFKGADMRRLCAGSYVRRYLCFVEFSRRIQQGLDRRLTGAPPRSSHLQWRFLDHRFPFGSCHLNCFRLLRHENCSIRQRTYCFGGQKGHCPCFHVRYVF